ncbi:MAG: type IV secretory system conjugative DNA transfer family protein, partial [Pseudomonadota bacterium]|nr:type IV secretory system conjugative DNA transfer family protein [Pseudomonadota bacterium]
MAFKRDEAYNEQQKCIKRVIGSIIMSFVFVFVSLLILVPLTQFIINGFGANSIGEAWQRVWKPSLTSWRGIVYVFNRYTSVLRAQDNPSPVMYLPYLSFSWPFCWLLYMIVTNPYNYRPNVFGSGRKATYADVEKMGLFKGFVIVLGRFKGKLLKMPETLSALVVAPPGTGKTAGVVIPTILESPGLSLIVNDPKPELCYNTTGYRATQGPVFVINWGAEDEPDK